MWIKEEKGNSLQPYYVKDICLLSKSLLGYLEHPVGVLLSLPSVLAADFQAAHEVVNAEVKYLGDIVELYSAAIQYLGPVLINRVHSVIFHIWRCILCIQSSDQGEPDRLLFQLGKGPGSESQYGEDKRSKISQSRPKILSFPDGKDLILALVPCHLVEQIQLVFIGCAFDIARRYEIKEFYSLIFVRIKVRVVEILHLLLDADIGVSCVKAIQLCIHTLHHIPLHCLVLVVLNGIEVCRHYFTTDLIVW